MSRSIRLTAAVLALAPIVALAGAWLTRWLNAPAAVPDHAALFSATTEMKVFGATTLAQTVRPTLDGLSGVDLVISTERASLPGDVQLAVAEWPSRRVVRTSRVVAASAPDGSAWRYRPSQPGERWLTFGFAPIAGSAGKDFLLTLSYPDGRDTAGDRVATLARFPNSYPPGELRVNDDRTNGTLLFRLAAAGTRGAALQVGLQNLARGQPVLTGTLALPIVLAVACGGLAAALGAAILAAKRPDGNGLLPCAQPARSSGTGS